MVQPCTLGASSLDHLLRDVVHQKGSPDVHWLARAGPLEQEPGREDREVQLEVLVQQKEHQVRRERDRTGLVGPMEGSQAPRHDSPQDLHQRQKAPVQKRLLPASMSRVGEIVAGLNHLVPTQHRCLQLHLMQLAFCQLIGEM